MRHETEQTYEAHGACIKTEKTYVEPGFIDGCVYYPGVLLAGELIIQ
jgi:hypothetical protein